MNSKKVESPNRSIKSENGDLSGIGSREGSYGGVDLRKPLAAIEGNVMKKNEEEKDDSRQEFVLDIDCSNRNDLYEVAAYAKEIYEYLFSLEEKRPLQANYLEDNELGAVRPTIIDWLCEVYGSSNHVSDTYQLSIILTDRYLQKAPYTRASHLQLIAVVAFSLAAKYEGVHVPSIQDLVDLTAATYSAKTIKKMEFLLLKRLDFDLNFPLPIHFLRRFCKAAALTDIQYVLAKYLCDLAITSYETLHFKPSEIAAASLFLSLNLLCKHSFKPKGLIFSFWTPTLEHYSHYSASDLLPMVRKIAVLARDAQNGPYINLFQQYAATTLYSISLRPELRSPVIESIIDQCV